MTRAYLALGGNLGDVAGEFLTALRALEAAEGVTLVAISRVYRTPPWGVTDQPDFLNMAAAIDTILSTRALLELCLRIEKTSGRVRDWLAQADASGVRVDDEATARVRA